MLLFLLVTGLLIIVTIIVAQNYIVSLTKRLLLLWLQLLWRALKWWQWLLLIDDSTITLLIFCCCCWLLPLLTLANDNNTCIAFLLFVFIFISSIYVFYWQNLGMKDDSTISSLVWLASAVIAIAVITTIIHIFNVASSSYALLFLLFLGLLGIVSLLFEDLNVKLFDFCIYYLGVRSLAKANTYMFFVVIAIMLFILFDYWRFTINVFLNQFNETVDLVIITTCLPNYFDLFHLHISQVLYIFVAILLAAIDFHVIYIWLLIGWWWERVCVYKILESFSLLTCFSLFYFVYR